jgi:hypothetical protein
MYRVLCNRNTGIGGIAWKGRMQTALCENTFICVLARSHMMKYNSIDFFDYFLDINFN